MYKNIVRYMTVGEPVIIGARPKPIVEPEPEPPKIEEEPEEEIEEDAEEESESEPEPEPERGIPQEVLDKVFAEIEEIEQKAQLTEETLRQAHKEKAESTQIKKQAEEIRKQAEEIRKQAEEIREQAEEKAEELHKQAEQHIQDANDEAEKIIAEAQAEAEKIINDTKHEAEELLKQVRKEGYDAGYEDGKVDGINDGKAKIEKDLKDVVRQANDKAQKTIRDAKEQTSEYFIRAEDDIVKVVMMAIDKIIPQHFLDVPQVILPVVREAIRHVRDQREIKVHVEPDSYDLVLMARSEFQSMLTSGTAIIEIISDEALKPGDCVIETPNGGVDARLSTQLDLMKYAIQNVLNNPL